MFDYSNIDPKVFDPEVIDSETAAFNEKIEKELSSQPPIYTLPPQVVREARAAGHSVFGPIVRRDEAEDRVVPGPAGDIPVRIFVPDTVKGVYMHIHGGGFMLGRANHFDEIIVGTGKRCSVAVVSVDYRLAPENPHPAAPDDCEAVAFWLAKNSSSEFGSKKIVVGGESAGANLSVVTLLRMRDRHDFTEFRGAVLSYGAYDLSMTPSARRWGGRNLVLTTKLMQWFHENYTTAEKYSDPDVSPLYGDLSGMPPALFTVGTLDPLLDDSLFMHMRWLAAGNASELAVYPGAIHAFNAFPIEIARRANARIVEFIDACLA
ncbi:MAG: alpha/beta hydrolase [Deltaproteobacteria bacterium]|nr:MAG: alpha/beta hydrolase [Deltaproteobacteria bacterium]